MVPSWSATALPGWAAGPSSSSPCTARKARVPGSRVVLSTRSTWMPGSGLTSSAGSISREGHTTRA